MSKASTAYFFVARKEDFIGSDLYISVLSILSCRGKGLKEVKAHGLSENVGTAPRDPRWKTALASISHGPEAEYLWAWAMHGPKARFTLALCQSPYLQRIFLGMILVSNLHDQLVPLMKN